MTFYLSAVRGLFVAMIIPSIFGHKLQFINKILVIPTRHLACRLSCHGYGCLRCRSIVERCTDGYKATELLVMESVVYARNIGALPTDVFTLGHPSCESFMSHICGGPSEIRHFTSRQRLSNFGQIKWTVEFDFFTLFSSKISGTPHR